MCMLNECCAKRYLGNHATYTVIMRTMSYNPIIRFDSTTRDLPTSLWPSYVKDNPAEVN